MRDAQNDPNERPIRAQREASFDLADKLTQLKRRQAAQSAYVMSNEHIVALT